MNRVFVPIIVVAALGLASCGDDGSTDPSAPPPWAKVGPVQIAAAKRHGVPIAFENEFGMRFVLIPEGTFLMGSPLDEPRRELDETQHQVTLTTPFYMQVTEVTNAHYRNFKHEHRTGQRHGDRAGLTGLDGDDKPVGEVSWEDATAFSAWLSRQDAGRDYQLPTETMWEYSCRAGTTTAFWFGETISPDQADVPAKTSWHGGPHRVGSFPPNAWGLHDTHGSVWEWCQNPYVAYLDRGETDPAGRAGNSNNARVLRGGSWRDWKRHARSARRLRHDADDVLKWYGVPVTCVYGFRLVSPLPESSQ